MLQPNPEYIRELVEIVNTSPFPEHMAMRLRSIELDKAVIELKTANYHLQAYGIVQWIVKGKLTIGGQLSADGAKMSGSLKFAQYSATWNATQQ